MIGRDLLRPMVVVVTAGTCCLAAGLLGGPALLRMTIAVVTLLTTAAASQRATVAMITRAGPYPRPRTAPPAGYPRYDDIVHQLSWGSQHPVYRHNVLDPWLTTLAKDLGAGPPEPDGPLPDIVSRLEQEVRDERR